MKKWIAGFLSLILLITGTVIALAEETVAEISWEPYAEALDGEEIDATYVLLDDTGVAVWMPDAFLAGYFADEDETSENPEEQEAAENLESAGNTEPAENPEAPEDPEAAESAEPDENEVELAEEVIALFGLEDGSVFIEVTIPELEDGVTIESLLAALMAQDTNDIILPVRINGLDGIYFQDENDQLILLLVEYEDGKLLKVMFCPIDDEGMNTVFEFIIASIQKPEIIE